MAVKGSASITLMFMIDIKATYRYYKLQSSTLAVPSVPTTANASTGAAPSGWTDIEPTYNSGATNSLYYVDLTVFTNDTWLYTKVSKSSSYEAAKEAWNKANNAQNSANDANGKIDGLQIGGRNLALDTNQGKINWVWNMQSGDFTIEDCDIDGVNGVSITKGRALAQTGWSVLEYTSINLNQFIPSTEYIVSFDVCPSVDTTFIIKLTTPSGLNSLTDSKTANLALANKWTKVSCILTTVDSLPVMSNQCIYITGHKSTNGVNYKFKNVKLEKGNKFTDWNPAPEDVEKKITTEIDSSLNKITLSVTDNFENGSKIKLTYDDTEISSSVISITATNIVNILAKDSVKINAKNINLNGVVTANNYFKIDTDGSMQCTSGKIGGWSINSYKIYSGTAEDGLAVMQSPTDTNLYVFAAGKNTRGHDSYGDCPFRVTKNGKLYATDAEIGGKITATSFKYSDNNFECTVSSGFTIKNKSDYISTSYSIYGINGSMSLFSDNLTFYTGSNFNGTSGMISFGIAGFSFSNDVEIDETLTVNDIYIPNTKYIHTNSSIGTVALIGMSGTSNIWIGGNDNVTAYGNCYIIAKNVYKRSSGSNTSLSDERYKHDIKDIEKSEEFIMSLSPKIYKFNDGTSGRYHTGFLANEVKDSMDSTIGDFGVFVRYTFNENVPIDADDPSTYICGLRYEEIIAPHVALTQKHNREITQLKDEIEKLKNELKNMSV